MESTKVTYLSMAIFTKADAMFHSASVKNLSKNTNFLKYIL